MRLREIDFLRGIAVILVLFRHNDYVPIINKIGWAGVDLFFVLSGFLVSGLLFQEYKTHKTISPKRFLIRRGFKIYPLFYLLLFITILIEQIFYYGVNKMSLLSDVIFLQSYLPGIWGHTWSLAVEEHFYLGLLLLVFLLVKSNRIESASSITLLFSGIFFFCLLFRLYNVNAYPYTNITHHFPTHLRIDSLFFGVFLSYFYYFRNDQFLLFFRKSRKPLYILSALLLLPVLIFHTRHPFMNSIGLTFAYLGFGTILALFISDDRIHIKLSQLFTRRLVNSVSFIGYCSYAIYLFHMPVRKYFQVLELSSGANFVIYFFGSIGIGIFVSKSVEQRILAFRDKMFPKKELMSVPARSHKITLSESTAVSLPS